MSLSSQAHRKEAPSHLSFYIVTVSTSKSRLAKKGLPPDDVSGELIRRRVIEEGHQVAGKTIIPDGLATIRNLVRKLINNETVDAIILTGGTGITHADVTIEAVTPLLEKPLPGFGELFRRISFETVGAAAVLTRATAGVAKGKAVFCLPGSPDSVKVALEKLIIPETPHIIKHARER
ncbi:MAG: molybdenum cofactor biosynthesis protein B [Candidatus Bathyarchaeia archaeon]